MDSTLVKLNKKGGITIPAEIRESLSLYTGSHLLIKIEGTTIIIKPAITLPTEEYSLQRKAEFLLNNAVGREDYARIVKEVRKMGFDPDTIEHDKPQ